MMALPDLRRHRGLTQRQVALAMGVTPPRISLVERRPVSELTIRSLALYVAGLGGELHVTVTFPDGEQVSL